MSKKNPMHFITALDEYVEIREIGQGGSGIVHLTESTGGQVFAIKVLRHQLIPDKNNRKSVRLSRFRNELGFLKNNVHPNIIKVLDYGCMIIHSEIIEKGSIKKIQKEVPFFVMKYYPTNLRKIVSSEILLPEKALEYFLCLMNGMQKVHQRRIWHRDLKPENILIDPAKSSLVIADFGIAHFSEAELLTTVKTERADRLANFQYAAPEQRKRDAIVDHRADIYSLGLILNEMLTGEIPYGSQYKRIADVIEGYSDLDTLIDKMIRQLPENRPQTVNEVRVAISKFQSSKFFSHQRNIDNPKCPTTHAEVDCAGRIDDMGLSTVLTISAGYFDSSILISLNEKKKVLRLLSRKYPNWGETRKRVFLYTILLFLLLEDYIEKFDLVLIDNEYPGYEPEIKGLLLKLLRETVKEVPKNRIYFKRNNRYAQSKLLASRVLNGNHSHTKVIEFSHISDYVK
jgi:serine/threonine protein kinase